MALTRPTLLPVPAFDATQQFTFTFTAQSGTSQIVANKLVIRNQDTNDIVYEEKQQTYRYEHTLNAGELTNGVYYNATLTVFDANDNESTASIPIQFWCYTTPVLTFTNMPDTDIISSASFSFAFTYTQAENEQINSYIMNLYNASQTLISTSGEVYTTDGTPPYNGSYLFAGFEDATVYYIELTATTIEGTVITTGRVQFTVQYTRPDLFTLVELQNNCEGGYIVLRSNFVLIEGESNPDPPTYIDNEEVDLRQEGSWVTWGEGFNITGDFLTRVWFRDPTPYTELFRFSNTDGQTISVSYMEGYENVEATDMEAYVEVHVTSMADMPYYIYSNYIPILPDTSQYNVWLTRKQNIYKVQIGQVT